MRGSKVNIWKYLEELKPFLQCGMSLTKACLVAKIPLRTVEDYMRKDPEVRGEIEAQREKGLAVCRQAIFKAAQKGDWRAALTILERLDRKDWAPPNKFELTGDDGGPIETVDLSKMAPEAIEAWLKAKLQKK